MTDASHDAIFCELTPPGRGGISTLGLFGPGILQTLQGVFRSSRPMEDGRDRLFYGRIVDEQGLPVDEVIVRVLGGTEAEVHCHGGPAAVEGVGCRLESCGIRRCTWAAFVSAHAEADGRGLIAAEAALWLPRLAALRPALIVAAQGNGLLAGAVRAVATSLGNGRVDEARERLDALLRSYQRTGRFIERPPHVAVVGMPNSGKSSLVNRLLGADRVIVTEIPGTTRDVVAETVSLDGLPVVLADTAGLRTAEDRVERIGVERARAEAATADVVVETCDLSGEAGTASGPGRESAGDARPPAVLRVGTKADLVSAGAVRGVVAVDVVTSAVTGQGIEELRRAILERLGFRWPDDGEPVPFTASQANALRAANCSIEQGRGDVALSLLTSFVPHA
ncbi:MAG: GTP-binding protein [Phycisphaerae bacterium]|nr:GTP-binding protein [Phycisphaerae bacterium]